MIEREGHSLIAPTEADMLDPAVQARTGLTPAAVPSTFLGAAASFAATMARFAASGFKTVDEPLHQLRMSHCQSCEYRHDTQCSLCRCFIAKKAWLPHEECPIGRWET